MDSVALLVVIGTFVSWGVGALIAKFAANRIGTQSVFWELVGYVPAILIFSLTVFRLRNLVGGDRVGIGLAMAAGAIGSLGAVGFYFLLTRAEVSTIAPLTALYPALTAVLAFIFLRESITPVKAFGIVLSLVAIYLLSKS